MKELFLLRESYGHLLNSANILHHLFPNLNILAFMCRFHELKDGVIPMYLGWSLTYLRSLLFSGCLDGCMDGWMDGGFIQGAKVNKK
jgi:hypothetical protein